MGETGGEGEGPQKPRSPEPKRVDKVSAQEQQRERIKIWEQIIGKPWSKMSEDRKREFLKMGGNPPPPDIESEVTPKKIEKSRNTWIAEQQRIKGRPLDVDELHSIDLIAQTGEMPMAGAMRYIAEAQESGPVIDAANRVAESARRAEEARRSRTNPDDDEQNAEPSEGIRHRILLDKVTEHFAQRPTDKAEAIMLTDEINGIIDRLPVMEAPNYQEILLAASAFRETRERLMSNTVFKAFEDRSETNDYRSSIGFYEGSNLASLITNLSKQDHERYLDYLVIQTAALYFQSMNSKLVVGTLNEFMGISENIGYQHFEAMKKIRGAPEVMRIYEDKYNEYKARYQTITSEGYEALKQEVTTTFRSMNSKGLLISEFADERTGDDAKKMKEWEVERALNVGRTFYNITFRSAEQIASGQVPRSEREGGVLGHKKITSPPFDSAVRILNWMQWSPFRFSIAEIRGGVDFLNRTKKNFFEFLRDRGRKLNENKIIKFGGMKTDEVEVGGMFGVSGFFSTWRNENSVLPAIEFNVGDRRFSIRKWLDENDEQIRAAKHLPKHFEKNPKKRNSKEIKEMEDRQNDLVRVLNDLIENNSMGLGVLLKQGLFSEEVGYEARVKVWEKVARDNLPLMFDYLSGLQLGKVGRDGVLETDKGGDLIPEGAELDKEGKIIYSTAAESLSSLKNILRGDTKVWSDQELKDLKNKLIFAHQSRINYQARIDISNAVLDTFNADELRIMGKIRDKGIELAPQFADIAFPYVPFMNDVPFGLLDYVGPGNEAFKRRNHDLASYSKAEGGFTAIMNNPTGEEPDKVIGHFDEIIKGIESPQGTTDAQERVFPMFKAWFDIIETKPGQRQNLLKAIKGGLRKPTSVAQDFAGIGAPSVNEPQIAALVNKSHEIGIVSTELAEELKKKKNAGLMGILWALFRDYWYMPFVIGGKQFTSAVASGK